MKLSDYLLRTACAGIILTALVLQYHANHLKEQPTGELTLATAAEREAFLNLRGWQVAEAEETAIRMPLTWQTQAGQSWLSLQAAQGLYPERYAGCNAMRYLYPVTNAESGTLYAELLLCGDVLIGAQVYNAETQLMQTVR